MIDRVQRRRRERCTGVRIAQSTGLSRATVSRILPRLKLNKIRMLEPTVPIVRYELPAPGDLLHIDSKQLARIHKPGHQPIRSRCQQPLDTPHLERAVRENSF